MTFIESMDDDDSIESLVGLGSRLEPENERPKEALPGRRPWLIFDFLRRARMCGVVRCWDECVAWAACQVVAGSENQRNILGYLKLQKFR